MPGQLASIEIATSRTHSILFESLRHGAVGGRRQGALHPALAAPFPLPCKGGRDPQEEMGALASGGGGGQWGELDHTCLRNEPNLLLNLAQTRALSALAQGP